MKFIYINETCRDNATFGKNRYKTFILKEVIYYCLCWLLTFALNCICTGCTYSVIVHLNMICLIEQTNYVCYTDRFIVDIHISLFNISSFSLTSLIVKNQRQLFQNRVMTLFCNFRYAALVIFNLISGCIQCYVTVMLFFNLNVCDVRGMWCDMTSENLNTFQIACS